MDLKGRDFLKLLDFTPEEIEYLLDLAADLKDKKKKGIPVDTLRGKNVALIFEKTSTRTRCAFEVAAHDLGMGTTYLDPTGTWNPIYVGCIAFACNADWFAEKGLEYPTSWEDLLKPEFKGEIIMAHPATSGTAYTVLATLVQLKGDDQVWDYLEKLNTNMSQYTKSGSAAPNAVAIGEAAIALTFSHDALQLTPEGYHIELSFPTDGTGYEVGAMALIKGGKADEQENAKKFIDWMTSEAGQGCYAENDSFRVPTNTAAPVADGLVTLDEVPVIDYDAVWAASVKSEYCEQFENKIATKPEG